ncbi:MAG: sigma-70 family RNA polymerase sigma factor [Planctomycetaceae bacterium]
MNRSFLEKLWSNSTSVTLIESLRLNAAEGWATFHRLYQPSVLSWCRHCGLRHQDAEEVYQETCLSTMRSINRFRLRPQQMCFRPWLWTIVRRRMVDWIRKSKEQIQARGGDFQAMLESIPERLPEDPVERTRWIVRGIEEARQQTSERLYTYFRMKYLESRSYEEIGERLGVSHFAVRRGCARFLAQLRTILGETVPEPMPGESPD